MLNFVERVEITFEETMSLIELMQKSSQMIYSVMILREENSRRLAN